MHAKQPPAFLAVVRYVDLMTEFPQAVTDHRQGDNIIVDNEYPHGRFVSSSVAAG
jgi:hypothetical protein